MQTMGTLFLCILLGFAAQLIDGSMGMAYGVSCNTFLRSVAGLPAAVSSASVHFAEIFTTFASGISHIKFKNVAKGIFTRLLIPGVIGGVLGAYLLADFYNEAWDPFIDAYLLIMGFVVLSKLFKKESKHREPGNLLYVLGLAGGFFDAVGGGGWGPVVTSTMVATNHDPKKTIGSVNTAEFFVTVAESITFFMVMKGEFLQYTYTILGLIIGGILAAPLAAWLTHKIPLKVMLGLVGGLIVGLNGWSLIKFFFLG